MTVRLLQELHLDSVRNFASPTEISNRNAVCPTIFNILSGKMPAEI